MKQLHFLLLAALSAALISCEQPINGVKIEQDSFVFTAEGGTQTLDLKADMPWSIALDDDSWCSVSPASGSNSTSVTVRVQPNPMKDRERSTRAVISYNEQTLSVQIRQEKNTGEAVFSINPKTVELAAEGGQFSFTVVSDAVDYEITIVDSWIKEVSRSGDRYTGETITFEASSNMKSEARSGVVSVCTKDGSCIPVMVSQAAFSGKSFTRLNMAYRFTATWCGYCPYMDETFQTYRKNNEDFDFVTLHASSGYPLYFADSGSLVSAYQVSGFPTGVINGWKEFNNSTDVDSAVSTLKQTISDFNKSFPCLAGVSVSSQLTDGGITVEATVEASLSGEYSIAAFLLESGIVQEQAYYPTTGGSTTIDDFVHNNVARKTLTGSPLGDSFTATAATPVKFNWSAQLDASWKAENLSVAVLLLAPYEKSSQKTNKKYPDNYVVNAAVAAAGKTFEMKYAD